MALTPQVTWPEGTVWPPQGGEDQPTPVDSPLAGAGDFGDSVASTEVDDAVIATLKAWMPDYLKYIHDSRNLLTYLDLPKESNYAAVLDPNWYKDFRLPGVFVATARVQGKPVVSNDGQYITLWLVATSVVARGRTPQETKRNVSLYELATRLILTQQGSLNGFAMGTDWVGGAEVKPVNDPNGKGRWLAEGSSQFWVQTACAGDRDAGPKVPGNYPYGTYPTVQEVDVDVESVPIEEGDE